MNNAPCNASVVALEEMVCMKLHRSTFEEVLGPLQALIDQSARARDAAAKHVQQQQQQAGLSAADRSQFRLRRRLCAQANGAVYFLAAHVRDKPGHEAKEYTLRIESIDAVASAGLQEEVLAEVALLKSLPLLLSSTSACLPPLLHTFHDEAALYSVFSGRALCSLEQLRVHKRLDEEARSHSDRTCGRGCV